MCRWYTVVGRIIAITSRIEVISHIRAAIEIQALTEAITEVLEATYRLVVAMDRSVFVGRRKLNLDSGVRGLTSGFFFTFTGGTKEALKYRETVFSHDT